MDRRPLKSTRTYTPFPDTTLVPSNPGAAAGEAEGRAGQDRRDLVTRSPRQGVADQLRGVEVGTARVDEDLGAGAGAGRDHRQRHRPGQHRDVALARRQPVAGPAYADDPGLDPGQIGRATCWDRWWHTV